MDIETVIRQFVIDSFLFGDDKSLKDDVSLLEEGIMDSTGVLELVAFLEEQFGISVEDEELVPENLDSVRKVVLYIQNKI